MRITDWLTEFKVSAELDDELGKYFYDNGTIDSILKDNKWLILGRKGTGKTAVYRQIKENLKIGNFEYRIIIPLDFSKYPYDLHKVFRETGENRLNAYRKSWKFFFYANIYAKIIQKYEANNYTLSKELKSISLVINAIYGSSEFPISKTLKSKKLELEKLKLPGVELFGVKANLGELDFSTRESNAYSIVRRNVFVLLNFFEFHAKSVFEKEKVFVLMDNLDMDWIEENLENSKLHIINLIGTISELNRSFKNLFIISFLRTDIFEELSFNDKNKLLQDSAHEIHWTKEHLINMYLNRLRNLDKSGFIGEKDDINILFNYKRVKNNAHPITYILNRTFFRPRDLIVYFNVIRKNFLKSMVKSKMYYPSELIYGSENEYSNYLYLELKDEWNSQKPEIDDYLAILQKLGRTDFKFFEFQIASNNYYEHKGIDKGQTRSEDFDILKFLYKISVIGQIMNGKSYFAFNQPYYEPNMEDKFLVNKGLHKRLSLKRRKSYPKISLRHPSNKNTGEDYPLLNDLL